MNSTTNTHILVWFLLSQLETTFLSLPVTKCDHLNQFWPAGEHKLYMPLSYHALKNTHMPSIFFSLFSAGWEIAIARLGKLHPLGLRDGSSTFSLAEPYWDNPSSTTLCI